MRIPRVIPLLLLSDGGMVKTERFGSPRYLGDPVNVVNLFNQFEVDEIVLLDIDATTEGRGPDIGLLSELANECWVPLTYGGGIRDIGQIEAVLGSGIEKVVLGAAAADQPALIAEGAARFGSQAIVVAVDVLAAGDGQEVRVDRGRRVVSTDPTDYARSAVLRGAGELLVQAIHRDGTMAGYDLDLIGHMAAAVDVPVVAAGGAGSRADLVGPIREAGAAAVAAGSLFVFRGPARGVLVNFPERPELERLLG